MAEMVWALTCTDAGVYTHELTGKENVAIQGEFVHGVVDDLPAVMGSFYVVARVSLPTADHYWIGTRFKSPSGQTLATHEEFYVPTDFGQTIIVLHFDGVEVHEEGDHLLEYYCKHGTFHKSLLKIVRRSYLDADRKDKG